MKKLLFLAVLLLPVLAQAGGPWPQKKGDSYVKLSEWWVSFDRHYTDAGLTDPNVTTGIYNTFLYAEYGFTDRLTGIANVNLFGRNTMNELQSATTSEIIVPGEALNSFGDVDLALKYGLTPSGSAWPVSVTVLFGVPTGNASGGVAGNLQTGDGEFNQLLRFDAGHGFKLFSKTDAYATVYAGVNNRSRGFSEELRLGAETGVQLLNKKLWIIGRLDVVESFKNGETSSSINSTSIFANNTEFVSIGAELNYYLTPKLGISAGVAGAVRGEIIAAAPSYSVGVFLDLKK
ncbi:MAG: hypothetical protein AB8F78_04180 [Saprospiraceae bacterium]